MGWVYLGLAGLFEIGWALGLKQSHGFTRLWWSLGTVASIVISLGLLALALRSVPIGTAYAVWSGIGIIGTAVAGVTLFGEPATGLRVACIGLVICGIVGLKLLPA
ncbi:MAG: multidrug efflux SMR transporter [Sphingomonadales bacterium]